MNLKYTVEFTRELKQLNKKERNKLDIIFVMLNNSGFSANLKAKKLHGKLADLLSFRFGKHWRIIYKYVDNDTIVMLRLGRRKDIYR